MNKAILIVIIIIIVYGGYKKVDCFELFVQGAKEGLSLFIPLFSSLLALMFFINTLIETGIIERICQLSFFKSISSELLSLMLLRPFSSSGSLLLLDKLYAHYGLYHFYSIVGTFIQSATDTTLYIASLYFGSLNIKNESKTVLLGLCLDALSILLAFIFAIICF